MASLTPADLRTRRQALGLSQQGLAERLGVHRQTVNRWERGQLAIDNPALIHLALRAIENEKTSET